MESHLEIKLARKKALWIAILSTIIYLLLLLPVLYCSMFSFMIVDSSIATFAISLPIIIASLAIPASLPVAIFRVWYKYLKKEYDKCLVNSLIPVNVSVCSFTLVSMFLKLFFE